MANTWAILLQSNTYITHNHCYHSSSTISAIMGYLTTLGRHILLLVLSIITCNAELAGSETPDKNPSVGVDKEDATGSTEHQKVQLLQEVATGSESDQQQQVPSEGSRSNQQSTRARSSFRKFTARSFSVDPEVPNQVLVVLYVSSLYDLLDMINVIVDAIVIIRLFMIDDGVYIYPSLLLIGLLLGRIVDYRGSKLLFRYGIEWYPFWIKTPESHGSPQSRKALSILYCLLFTEAAIFLLEDYPSLVVYDHWMVVGFPPPELEYMDNVNVAMSAASMFILWGLFFAALSVALYRLLVKYEWSTWTTTTRLWNLSKILVFGAAVFFLARYVLHMLLSAITLVLDDERSLPSNTFFGFTLCDPPVSFADRQDYCHEQIFILQVISAWFTAAVFTAYVIFRPAAIVIDESRNDGEDDHQDDNNQEDKNQEDFPSPSASLVHQSSVLMDGNGKEVTVNDIEERAAVDKIEHDV